MTTTAVTCTPGMGRSQEKSAWSAQEDSTRWDAEGEKRRAAGQRAQRPSGREAWMQSGRPATVPSTPGAGPETLTTPAPMCPLGQPWRYPAWVFLSPLFAATSVPDECCKFKSHALNFKC